MGRLWRRRSSRGDRKDLVRRPVAGDYLTVQPMPGGRLSQGLVVDASILARLLGVRLLRLDARLTFVPASPAIHVPGSSTALLAPPGSLDDAAKLLAHATRTLADVNRG